MGTSWMACSSITRRVSCGGACNEGGGWSQENGVFMESNDVLTGFTVVSMAFNGVLLSDITSNVREARWICDSIKPSLPGRSSIHRDLPVMFGSCGHGPYMFFFFKTVRYVLCIISL